MQTFSSNLKKEFFKHYSLVFVVFAFFFLDQAMSEVKNLIRG